MAYPSNFIDTTGMTMEDVKQACPDSWSLSQIWECRNGIDCWTKQCYRFHIGVRVVETPNGACKYHFYNGFCKWNDKKKRNPNNPRFKPCKHSIHIYKDDYIEQIEEKIKWEKENKIDNEVIDNEVIDNEVIDNEVIDNDVVEEKEEAPPLDDSDGYDSVEVVDTDDEGNKENVPPLLSDIAKKLDPSPKVIWVKCAWLDEYEEQ
jgi:hypothetical protein